jgi:uncharacterized protein YlxW (UPF0749 family)
MFMTIHFLDSHEYFFLLFILRTQQYQKEQGRNADQMKNLLNHCTNELEFTVKKLEYIDAHFIECKQQIKDMAEEKDAKQKQLEDLQKAAQVAVNMVDPLEEGVVVDRTLLE